MNKSFFRLSAALVALTLTAIACGFSVTTANISDAYMAKDKDGNERTTAFNGGDTFYAIVVVSNAPDDTVVKAVWIAVNAEGEDPNLTIEETSYTTGDAQLYFSLTNQEGLLWPNGQYRVDLYINDKLEKSLEFQVQ